MGVKKGRGGLEQADLAAIAACDGAEAALQRVAFRLSPMVLTLRPPCCCSATERI